MSDSTLQENWDHVDDLRDINGETTLTWRSKEAKEKWAPLFEPRTFSLREDMEFHQMLNDKADRDVMIIHFNHRNRHAWLKRLSAHELYYRKIKEIKPFNGFSQSHSHTDQNDPERVSYSVISTSEEAANEVQHAELNLKGEEKHRIIGNRLGFPDCCIDNLIGSYSESPQYPEMMYRAATQTGSAEPIDSVEHGVRIPRDTFHPGMPVWRNSGLKIITHSPHAFDCEGSQKIAEQRLQVLEEIGDTNIANLLREWYKEPFIWESKNGIETIRNKYLTVMTTGHHTTTRLRVEGGDVTQI